MNVSTTRRFPPIIQISTTILILVIASGIYVASHLPKSVSLTPSVVLVSVAAILALVNMVLLSRIENFAWKTFFLVAKWSFLAYLVIAGILEFVFIKDGTRGSVLFLLTSTLAIFAINLPMLFGFTVAQYHEN